MQSSQQVAEFIRESLVNRVELVPANEPVPTEVVNLDPWGSAFTIDLKNFGAHERFMVTVRAVN